jgi:hypothetical protein
MFENKVPRRIFGLKTQEIRGQWTKIYEKLHDIYLNLQQILLTLKNHGE